MKVVSVEQQQQDNFNIIFFSNFDSRVSGDIMTPSVTSCTEVQKWSHLKYFSVK